MNPKFRASFFNNILFLCAVVVGLLISEMILRYVVVSNEDRHAGAEVLFSAFSDIFTQKELDDSVHKGCSWSDSVVAHPYLGWVHRHDGPCALSGVNNRGFLQSHDIPMDRDPEFYSILVVGGSVASQLEGGEWNHKIWLEEILNEKYISPNGEPFRVLPGAFGSWKFPTQNIAVVLYGNAVDAVVSVDGYNESLSGKLDMPDLKLAHTLTREGSESTPLISFRMVRWWRDTCLENPILKHSFLALYLMRWAIAQSEKEMSTNIPGEIQREFSFPSAYPFGKRASWNHERYKYYVRLLNGEAKLLGLKFAHFLQPIPDYMKTLTPEELAHTRFVPYKKYAPFLAASDELAKEGIASYSLAGIFSNIKGTIYGDEIHCKFDAKGDSRGYRIMSEAIVNKLAIAWKLRKKRKP